MPASPQDVVMQAMSAAPLHLALCPGTTGGGGIGMVFLNLAEGLVAEGHRVDLLAFETALSRPIPNGVAVHLMGGRARSALPGAVRYFRAARPDAVISGRDYVNLTILAASRLARSKVPLIWTFHTHRASEQAMAAGWKDRAADLFSRAFLSQATGRVAVSHAVAAGLANDTGLPASQLQVIENPVWTAARLAQRFTPCAHPWLSARAPMRDGSGGDGPPMSEARTRVVVAVGRLVRQKGFDTLIEAFASIAPGGARLIVLGEGPEREVLAAQVARLGLGAQVALVGHVPDVLPYLSRADLYVMPSRWEGFPLALVEALGAGAPIVASDCPGGVSEILEGGRLGRLVPPNDHDALSRAMRDVLHAAPDPVECAARIAAGLRFDANRAARRYAALARKIGA